MTQNLIPIQFATIDDNVYAGFWKRLGAYLIDLLIILPIGFGIAYLTGLDKNAYYYTFIPSLLLFSFYNIYLVKVYGGTPGKLIVGIKIINANGNNVGYVEATKRYFIDILLALFSGAVMIYSLSVISEDTFLSLSFIERSKELKAINPTLNSVHVWLANIWVWSEFIVLLTNPRKRAIHDYIGGTVVIKEKYHNKILEEVNLPKSNTYLSPDLKLVGSLIPSVFLVSFIALMLTNKFVLPEINSLGITGFNIIDFEQQLPVDFMNYGMTGFLIVLFSLLLAKDQRWNSPTMYGALMLTISGIAWLSFGLFPLEVEGDNAIFGVSHLLLVHLCWLPAIIGIALFLPELHEKYSSNGIRIVTIVALTLMILDTIYQGTLEYSGIVGSIGYFVYMTWFAIFPFLIKSPDANKSSRCTTH